VQTEPSIYLPAQLECFRNAIESSAVNSLRICPTNGKPSLTDSKFAGFPYLPKSYLHPKDSNGVFMPLLAQINFAQLPSIPHFPTDGVLQFFLSTKFNHPLEEKSESIFQQDFKVRYFPSLLDKNQLIHDFSYLETSNDFPVHKEVKLAFHHTAEPVSASDYRREHYLASSKLKNQFVSEDGRTFDDLYFEKFMAAEHKLGGYPYFIETDSRRDSTLLKKFDTLLFQIVSNDEQGIMYGDSGILKFFINKQNLSKRDFSVIYFIAEQF